MALNEETLQARKALVKRHKKFINMSDLMKKELAFKKKNPNFRFKHRLTEQINKENEEKKKRIIIETKKINDEAKNNGKKQCKSSQKL